MWNVSALEALFLPGSQYAHEERQRLEHSREDPGSNGPGCGPIDLSSGKVLITLPPEPEAVLPPRPRVEEDPAGDPADATL